VLALGTTPSLDSIFFWIMDSNHRFKLIGLRLNLLTNPKIQVLPNILLDFILSAYEASFYMNGY
jgi:hypothetical protein